MSCSSRSRDDSTSGLWVDPICGRQLPFSDLEASGDDDDEQNRCRNQEHEAIVDALEKRDRKKAIRVMNQHLLHIESKIREQPEAAKTDLASLLRPMANGQPA